MDRKKEQDTLLGKCLFSPGDREKMNTRYTPRCPMLRPESQNLGSHSIANSAR